MSHLAEYLQHDTDTYKERPTVEEGHTKACLANAAISALQNLRDDEGVSDFDFAVWLQESGPHYTALDYLNESQLSDCLCPERDREMRHYWTVYSYVTSGGSYKTNLFCTLTEAIMEAEESRALNPDVEATAVGREIYTFTGEVSYFWTSIDFGKTL